MLVPRKRVAMGCLAVAVLLAATSAAPDHSSSSHIVPLLRRAQESPTPSPSESPGGVKGQSVTPDSNASVVTQFPASSTMSPESTPVPTPATTATPEMKTSMLVGVILGSVAAVLVALATVLICRRRQAQARAKVIFKGGPSTTSTESDDPAKQQQHRRGGEPFSSVYATDFASSDYRDSHSPSNHFDGIVLSDPFRRKDRVKPELDRPAPFFSYYHQGASQRRSSLESQDSSIISYTESERMRGTTTSSAADETPRQQLNTPMMAYQANARDDSLSSSVTAGYGREMWGGSSARISGISTSFSSAGIDSPSIVGGGAYSLPEKMTMLDDGGSQTSSRESYDI